MLVGKQSELYFGKDCQPDAINNFTKQHTTYMYMYIAYCYLSDPDQCS